MIGLLAVQVIHVNSAPRMGQTGNDDNATRSRFLENVPDGYLMYLTNIIHPYLQHIEQEVSQQKVSNVVDTQLQFEAVLGQHFGAAHHAGIVDQDIELVLLLLETSKGNKL